MLQLKNNKAQIIVYAWFNKGLSNPFLNVHLTHIKRGMSLLELKAIRQIVDNVPNDFLPEQLYPMLFLYYTQTQTPLRGNVFNALKNWNGVETLSKEWLKANLEKYINVLNLQLDLLHVQRVELHLQQLYSTFALSDLLLKE